MKIASGRLRTGIGLSVTAIASVLALAACGSSAPASGSAANAAPGKANNKSIDTLKVAVPGARTNLYTGVQSGTVNHWIENNVQEGLVRPAGHGTYKPALATSWKQPNPTTYVFELRQNAKFSTGQSLTAADVIASIKFAESAKYSPGISYEYANVKSVTQTGSHELTIKLDHPQSSFLSVVSPAGGLWVSPASWLKTHASSIGTPSGLIVGTGPYKVTKFIPSEGVWLTATNTWWGGAPKVKNIVFTFFNDNNAELLAAKSGSVDLALWVMPTQESQWNSLSGFTVLNAAQASYVGLLFNVKDKPFNNILVRKALAEAFDRKTFVDDVLKGGDSQVATALTPPISLQSGSGVAGATAELGKLTQPTYNLANAKKLLAEAGYPHGFSTKLEWPNNGPQLGLAAQALAQNLKQIGVNVTVSEVPIAQWLSLSTGLNFMWDQVFTGDPGEYVEYMVGPGNPSGYKSAEATSLVNKEESESGSSARAQAVIALNNLAMNKAVIEVPYWWEPIGMAFKDGFTLPGYDATSFFAPWAANIRSTS